MLKFNSRKFRTNLHDLGQAVDVVTTGRWIFYCILVGALAGLAALLFSLTLDVVEELALHYLGGFDLPKTGGKHNLAHLRLTPLFSDGYGFLGDWLIILIPAFGALVSGILVYRFAVEAEGSGTDSVIRAFHKQKGRIQARVPAIKLITSVFTIGTGGSAGKEGPIAQVGAGIGSVLADFFNMTERERKILLMAGMGAGIGAIFKAPIGGALFAIEVMYHKDMESEGVVATIIAAIIGYSVYASFDGWDSIFSFQSPSFTNPYELPLYILLALVVMIAGIIYAKVFSLARKQFQNLEIPRYMKPALGGLMVGAIAIIFPAVLGSGYGHLQAALNGNLTIKFMLLLVVLKTLATAFTVQSGGSGGLFAPSLIIGGLLGGIMGVGINTLFPGMLANPTSFVLVGMAAFFAGVANVPVSSTILITEMSKSYGLIVPLIFASVIAYLGAQNWSIYREQLEDHQASKAYRGAFLHEVLHSIKVRSACKRIHNLPRVNLRDSAHQILQAFGQSETLVLPVENDEKEIIGMVSLYDVRNLLDEKLENIVIAADLMTPPKFLNMNDPLSKAFNYFVETGEPELLVQSPGNGTRFIGVLGERDFLLAYQRAMTGQPET